MEMTEVFDRLKKLQDVLVQKYAIEAEIEDAPSRHSRDNELLARQKQEFIDKSISYEKVKEQVLSYRKQLAEAEAKRESSEKAMDSISTQREYEALTKEISDAEQVSNTVRKELQKEERNLEELNDSIKIAEESIKEQEEYLKESEEKLSSQIEEKKKELESLNTQQAKITPELDQELIFKFERIIKSKNKEKNETEGGIVVVKGNVCSGCHMILPAEFANKVRDKVTTEPQFCPYCSRILYYKEDESEGTEEYLSTTVETPMDQDVEDFIDDDETNEMLSDDE